jgi:hypothetical protein
VVVGDRVESQAIAFEGLGRLALPDALPPNAWVVIRYVPVAETFLSGVLIRLLGSTRTARVKKHIHENVKRASSVSWVQLIFP